MKLGGTKRKQRKQLYTQNTNYDTKFKSHTKKINYIIQNKNKNKNFMAKNTIESKTSVRLEVCIWIYMTTCSNLIYIFAK